MPLEEIRTHCCADTPLDRTVSPACDQRDGIRIPEILDQVSPGPGATRGVLSRPASANL